MKVNERNRIKISKRSGNDLERLFLNCSRGASSADDVRVRVCTEIRVIEIENRDTPAQSHHMVLVAYKCNQKNSQENGQVFFSAIDLILNMQRQGINKFSVHFSSSNTSLRRKMLSSRRAAWSTPP